MGAVLRVLLVVLMLGLVAAVAAVDAHSTQYPPAISEPLGPSRVVIPPLRPECEARCERTQWNWSTEIESPEPALSADADDAPDNPSIDTTLSLQ